MRLTLGFFIPVLVTFMTAGSAYPASSSFDSIMHSLPREEPGWKVTEVVEPVRNRDGSVQGGFLWVKGMEEVGATVILHKSLKAAKREFRSSSQCDASLDDFLIDGIGDEAYLFPPIVRDPDGSYNLRFRKGRYEILLSAISRDLLIRCSRHIIGAMASKNK
jgi:hypothetical protein